jgi:hypothetical protein
MHRVCDSAHLGVASPLGLRPGPTRLGQQLIELLYFGESQSGAWLVFWTTFIGLLLTAPRALLCPDIDSKWFVDSD